MPPDRIEKLIGTERSGRISEFETTSKVHKSFSIYKVEKAKEIKLKPGEVLKGRILAVFNRGEFKEVEVDFGSFKVKARWNSYLTPEVGKKILVLVKETSPQIVLKLIETKVANLREFFLESFNSREEVFSLVRKLVGTNAAELNLESVKRLVKNSGLFLENKIHKANYEGINNDIKVKLLSLLSKVPEDKAEQVFKVLNILESYSISNLLSKNFFLIPLFLPYPPFIRAELFIDKKNLKFFRQQGFLTVIIILELEKYGKVKISLLFDREQKTFDIAFSSHSKELLNLLKKNQKILTDILQSKYKIKISYKQEVPQSPEILFSEIPKEL